MARRLGYAGLFNTEGARDFTGKTLAVVIARAVGNLIPKLKLMGRL